MSGTQPTKYKWTITPALWTLLFAIVADAIYVFYDGLRYMVTTWETKEEYSYGFFIPVIVTFLIWQKKEQLLRMSFSGAWTGLIIVILGLGALVIGNLSALYVIVQYGFIVVVMGFALAFLGWPGFRKVFVPLLMLGFMIPLPEFLYNNLSANLQLISSKLGVAIVRLLGISVFLQGNVIDLGTFKLQVIDACSGLRYLFPLMTLGFIASYFFKGALWKKSIIFLSSAPITVFMNSFRIAMIAVLVDGWGTSMAEGFLHDFEGWVVFMASTGMLVLEMWFLARIGKQRSSLREAFGLDLPASYAKTLPARSRGIPRPLLGSALLLLIVSILSLTLPNRAEDVPARENFSDFPTKLGDWRGQTERLDQIYLDVLKLDDYIMSDYTDPHGRRINLYVAYYGSQRKGQSAHSPRSCIPGDGWEIQSLSQREIGDVLIKGKKLRINRVLIQKGESTQLVYYWFQQRGRVITNEYLVKWYLFWDALKRNRTDGSLVRITTDVRKGEDLAQADALLASFIRLAVPALVPYVPN